MLYAVEAGYLSDRDGHWHPHLMFFMHEPTPLPGETASRDLRSSPLMTLGFRCQSGRTDQLITKNGWGERFRRFASRPHRALAAATLLADGAPFFAICACPALVIKRDFSYISIHFPLEIAEISLPISSSGKSSGDSK